MVTALGQASWWRLSERASPLSDISLRQLAPLLLIIPHPDDETLGCGGLIATAAARGIPLHVVYLTDGGASHSGSPTWPRQRLVAQREREALAALVCLGADSREVSFLGWRDGHPARTGDALWNRTIKALLALALRTGAKSIWSPWRGETHPDHHAAYRIAEALGSDIKPPVPHFEYLVWGWSQRGLARRQAQRTVLGLPCAETIELRREALSHHKTQLGSVITDAAEAFVIPPALAAITQRPIELYFGP